MAFGKDFYLGQTDAAVLSSKYVFCALVSDLSELTFDPRFCSDEVGQTSDSLLNALTACGALANLENGIGDLLTDASVKYYLMQATGDRWIAIKRKSENKGFSFYDPMDSVKEKFASRDALMAALSETYGVDEQTPVIAVEAE